MSSVTATRAPDPPDHLDEHRARRLAVLLAERRRLAGLGLRTVARASRGAFTVRELRQIEAAELALEPERAAAVARLYGIDATVVGAQRPPLAIDPQGTITAGGRSVSFDPADAASLLASYVDLVRTVRNEGHPGAIRLRRRDVEVIAQFLEQPGETVVEHLARQMGATPLQQRVLAGMYVAGTITIGLSAAVADDPRRAAATVTATPPAH